MDSMIMAVKDITDRRKREKICRQKWYLGLPVCTPLSVCMLFSACTTEKEEMEEVPADYFQACKNSGTIETLEYVSKDYTGSGRKWDFLCRSVVRTGA